MCVTVYLIVLSVEMSPSVLEGLKARIDEGDWGAVLLRRFEKPLLALAAGVRIVLPLFIVAGVVLSFMHQSSLGSLMLIAPTKLSPLWNTPILPLLFLLSAIMVGFPMVILESIYANISFGRSPEMELLTPLARIVPWFIGTYGVVKIGDLVVRYGQLNFLDHPAATTSLVVEILLGIVAPFLLFLNKAVRRSDGVALLHRIPDHLRRGAQPHQRLPGRLQPAVLRQGVLPVDRRDRDDGGHRLQHPVLLPVLRDVLPHPAGLRACDGGPARPDARGAGADRRSLLDLGDPGDRDRLPPGFHRAVQPGAYPRPSRRPSRRSRRSSASRRSCPLARRPWRARPTPSGPRRTRTITC